MTNSRIIQLPKSLDNWMRKFGDDFGFMETASESEVAVSHPGTYERIEEMRQRVQRGQPLFVRGDSVDFAGGVCEVEPPTISTLWEGNEHCGIELSMDGRYQYRAMEIWEPGKPVVLFVGLYPTSIRAKLTSLAHSLGCGGMQIVNIFALRVDDEEELVEATIGEAIGPLNDRTIRIAAMTSQYCVIGWGENAPGFRSVDVFRGIRNSRSKSRIFCYGLTNPVGGRRFPVPFRSVKVGSPLVPVYEHQIVKKDLGVSDDGE